MKITSIEDLRRYQSNHRLADNLKMVTVIVLILSVMLFTAIGKSNVKPIIWQWATFMVLLLIINVILDVIAHKKDKKQ